MLKILIFLLLFPLLFALKAPNFAYNAALGPLSAPGAPLSVALAQESSPMPSEAENWLEMTLPKGPLDPWLEKLKGGAQDLMNQAQNRLQQAAGQASESAQEAVKEEIQRQAQQGIQAAQKGLLASWQGIWNNIKNKIGEIILNIKNYFQEIYWKFTTKTY